MAKSKGDGEFEIYEDSTSQNDTASGLGSPLSLRSPSGETVIHNEDLRSDNGKDAHTEALIQEAARNIIEQIEQDAYNRRAGVKAAAPRSEISYSGTENTFDESELTYDEGTDYDDGTEINYNSGSQYEPTIQNDDDASSSSHHEDDVFSHGRRSSGGSLNSSNAARSPTKQLSRAQTPNLFPPSYMGDISGDKSKQPQISVQECESDTPIVSRIPSAATNVTYSMLYTDTTPTHSHRGGTHIKANSLPLSSFRSPGSIRNLQMSTSPAPSVFNGNSPQSRKRPLTPRAGTPTANRLGSSPLKKATPIFVDKGESMVLLQLKVLPLKWKYAEAIESTPDDELSLDLLNVKESWKILKEKVGDTVLERGVLIAHPQESYEILEERLFAALELPNRPRAKILDCGHYIGPTALTDYDDDTDMSCSEDDDDDNESVHSVSRGSTWCDVCCRDVKYGSSLGGPKKKLYKMKIFASNGLMGAGAWSAAWRQMTSADVEIEVITEPGVAIELSDLFDSVMSPHRSRSRLGDEHAYEEEDTLQPGGERDLSDPFIDSPFVKFAKLEELPLPTSPSPSTQLVASPPQETAVAEPILSTPEKTTRELEEEIRRIEREQARLNEVYGEHAATSSPSMALASSPPRDQQHDENMQHTPQHNTQHDRSQDQSPQYRSNSAQSNHSSHSNRAQTPPRRRHEVDSDSFVDLLLATIRVLLQDKKNIVIGFLGILVFVLAMRVGQVQIHGAGGGLEDSIQRQQMAMQRLQMSHAQEVPKMQVPAPQVQVSVPEMVAAAPVAPVVEPVRYEQMPARQEEQAPRVQRPHPVVEPFLANTAETVVRQAIIPPRSYKEEEQVISQANAPLAPEPKTIDALPVADPIKSAPVIADQAEILDKADQDNIAAPVEPSASDIEPSLDAEVKQTVEKKAYEPRTAMGRPKVEPDVVIEDDEEAKPGVEEVEEVKTPVVERSAMGRPEKIEPFLADEPAVKAESDEVVEVEKPIIEKTASSRPKVEPFFVDAEGSN